MKQAKTAVCIMVIAYGLLVLAAVCKPADDFSISERRKLAQRPEFTVEAVKNGSFMTKTEEYAADQFPFRDGFRSVKALFSLGIMQNNDTNGIYYKNGYLAKMEYPMDERSIQRAADVFEKINSNLLAGTNVRSYLCVIPDKNYVLAEEEQLSMDYDVFIGKMEAEASFLTPVSIKENIQASDFYKTDTHWKQEEIIDIAAKLAENMDVPFWGEFEYKEAETPFYGVYYGQAALPIEPDRLTYCTNEVLDACRVYDYENDKEIPLYDLSKTTGRDPYEMFLGGNISLAVIDSPKALSSKELVVFGDSFARSLLPLFAESYAKITLIDIRYLPSTAVGNYVTFSEQDVLFLYSTSVLNNSITLK